MQRPSLYIAIICIGCPFCLLLRKNEVEAGPSYSVYDSNSHRHKRTPNRSNGDPGAVLWPEGRGRVFSWLLWLGGVYIRIRTSATAACRHAVCPGQNDCRCGKEDG